MTLEIEPKKPVHKKDVVLIVVAAAVALIILIVSIYGYTQHRAHVEDKKRQEASQQAVIKNNQEADKKRQEAQVGADLSRLVSICMEAKARYDALPAAQKVKETNPDCTIHVQ